MLGALAPEAQAAVRSLRASFAGPLPVGAGGELAVIPSPREPDAWEVRLTARGRTLARVQTRAHGPAEREPLTVAGPGGGLTAQRTTPAEPPLEPGYAVAGAWSPGPELGQIAAALGADRVEPVLLEGLAWASYVVGMEVPGLNSLFSGLTLALEADASGAGRREPPARAARARRPDRAPDRGRPPGQPGRRRHRHDRVLRATGRAGSRSARPRA